MKRFKLFLFLILIISLTHGKNFNIINANLEYNINSNGTINVKEVIKYGLHGCFKELYLQKPPSLKIYNARGYCIGAKCNFRVDEPSESITGDRELILELKEGGCDNRVTAVFEYDIAVLRKNKDNVQFFYKLWGDKWSKYTDVFIKIILPGNANETTFWLHKNDGEIRYYTKEIKDNIITLSKSMPANTFFEINLLMPVEWFDKDAYYIEKSNMTKEDIKEIEKKDKENKKLNSKTIETILTLVYLLLTVLPLAVFLFAYFKYGRELSKEEVGYNKKYETYPPYDMSAAQASFYLNGRVEKNAFTATIMMLVHKNYLDIEEDKKKKDIIIKIKEPKIKKKLTKDEEMVLELIKKYSKNGLFSIKEFKKKSAFNKELVKWYKKWEDTVKKTVKGDLDSKTHNIFLLFLFVWLFFSAYIVILPIPSAFISLILLIIVGPKPSILGRWSREGRIKNLRWNAFREYLKDYTLLKEKPPSSIELWDLLMVYAIAFGVAERVLRAMKVDPSYNKLNDSGRYATYSLIMRGSFNSAFTAFSSHGRSGGGSSFGGAGGGFGGGGGGAR